MEGHVTGSSSAGTSTGGTSTTGSSVTSATSSSSTDAIIQVSSHNLSVTSSHVFLFSFFFRSHCVRCLQRVHSTLNWTVLWS
jgi:hypothetical protein